MYSSPLIILSLFFFLILYLIDVYDASLAPNWKYGVFSSNNPSITGLSVDDLSFLHIPKTGGSSIETMALANHKAWGRYYFKGSSFLTPLPCSTWHIPPHYFPHSPYKDKYVFCATREPFDRLISAYRSRRQRCDKNSLNIWINETFEEIYKHTYEIVRKGGPNQNFQYRYYWDCHLLPQSEFIFDHAGKRTCHFILRKSHLSLDFKKLSRIFNLEMDLNQYHENEKSSGCDLKKEDINDENVRLLKQIYKDDFQLFSSNSFVRFMSLEEVTF